MYLALQYLRCRNWQFIKSDAIATAHEETNVSVTTVRRKTRVRERYRRNTSGRATEPKCELMLAKSPESVHKKLELIAPVFFELSCNSKVVTHIRTDGRTDWRAYGTSQRYIPRRLLAAGIIPAVNELLPQKLLARLVKCSCYSMELLL